MVENPNVSTTSARQLQSRGAVAMPQREGSGGRRRPRPERKCLTTDARYRKSKEGNVPFSGKLTACPGPRRILFLKSCRAETVAGKLEPSLTCLAYPGTDLILYSIHLFAECFFCMGSGNAHRSPHCNDCIHRAAFDDHLDHDDFDNQHYDNINSRSVASATRRCQCRRLRCCTTSFTDLSMCR